MKRQYMDFVPAKSTQKSVTHDRATVAPAVTTHKTTKISTTTSRYTYVAAPAKPKAPSRSAPNSNSGLGVIEDLSAHSENISTPKPASKKPSLLKSIKSQKVGNKAPVKPVEKPVENPAKKSLSATQKSTFTPPKFINQDKVTKRPLSKNVYRKKIEPAKESNKKPVTIITKPEKDTKAGVIITIIITIILGAAAGTIAFLLLPK